MNAGVPDGYRTVRPGEAELAARENASVNKAYDAAKAGGANAGMLKNLARYGGPQLRSSRESLLRQAKVHEEKIANPAAYVKDWGARSEAYRVGLVAKWSTEVHNFRSQADVIQGYMDERGI